MTSWYYVEVTWDEDNLYEIAVEAESPEHAQAIALSRAPTPIAKVVGGGNRQPSEWDFDEVISLEGEDA